MGRLQNTSMWIRLLTILISIFTISSMVFYHVKSQYQMVVATEQNKLDIIAKHLELNLNARLMALQFLASDLEIKELDSEKIHNELVRPVDILKAFNAGVFDKQGKLVAEARYLTPMTEVQDRKSFNEVLKGHQVISDVISNNIIHNVYVSLRVPIYDDNVQVKAVLTADILLDELAEWVDHEPLDANRYIFIKDNNNNIIYRPACKRVYEGNGIPYDINIDFGQQDKGRLVNKAVDELYIYNTLEKSNWRIVMVLPQNQIYINLLGKSMPHLVLLCLLALCIGLLYRNLLQARCFEENVRRLRMERMMTANQLAAGLAHEVRNPLTAIKGFIQLMGRKVDKVPNQNYVEIMLTEIDRIDSLLGEFQMLTLPLKTLDFIKIDVEQMIHDVILLMKGQAKNNNIKLEVSKKTSLVRDDYLNLMDGIVLPENYQTLGNKDQLKQVLINLLKNAIDAIGQNGVIDVVLSNQGKMIVVTIRDNGAGMSSDVLGKIGTPFFTTKEGGNGVGLSICYNIIEGHGGRIEVDSEVGKGTVFSVMLSSIQ